MSTMEQNETKRIAELYDMYRKGLISEKEFAELKSRQAETCHNASSQQRKPSWFDGFGKVAKTVVFAACLFFDIAVIGCLAYVLMDNCGLVHQFSRELCQNDTTLCNSLTDTTMTNRIADATRPNVTITRLRVEHGVYENGLKGMRLHYKVEVNNHQNDTLNFAVLFYKGEDKADGKLYSGTYQGYRTDEGQVCVSDDNKVHFDKSVWEDISFFIPVDAMSNTFNPGKYDLSAQLEVREIDNEHKLLASSDVFNFNLIKHSNNDNQPIEKNPTLLDSHDFFNSHEI